MKLISSKGIRRKRRMDLTSFLKLFLFVIWVILFSSVWYISNIRISNNRNIYSEDLQLISINKDKMGYYHNDQNRPVRIGNDRRTLHLYFINSDESIHRASDLNKDMAYLSWRSQLSSATSSRQRFQLHRVPAVTVNEVKEMYNNGSLYFQQAEKEEELWKEDLNITATTPNQTILIDRPRTDEDINTFTFEEVACTLSHLRAIKQAYDDGRDIAIILEDDILISTEFIDNWESYANQAPKDWQILQWMNRNIRANKRALHTRHDFWVAWRWYFWGADFYTIRREGMERIIDASYKKIVKNNNGDSHVSHSTQYTDQWIFNEPQVVTADSLIFYSAKTYTSTYPWISLRDCSRITSHNDLENCTYGKSSIMTSPPELTDSQLATLNRPETIAIVMNLRLKDIPSARDEIQSIRVDVEAFSNVQRNSRWFIKIVLVDDSLKPFVEDMITSYFPASGIGSMVDMHLEVKSDRFNKFGFLRTVLDEVTTYDYVLLKDNDIVLAGFEWNTFMDAKGNSTLSSPFYETSEEWLERNRFKRYYSRQHVNLQHSVLFNKYDDESYSSPLHPISTMVLEMKLVLMKSEFVHWFFSQIFQAEFFIHQDISWGIDLMWCGAAYQFNVAHDNDNVNACSIVPLNILDRDTKQISKADDFKSRGGDLVKIWRSDPRFSSWFSELNPSLTPNKYTIRRARKLCKELDENIVTLSQCGKAIISVVVKDYELGT